jgi:hypothetical protein
MDFLNKLTPEQEQFALQIAEQAKTMGVDAKLAVALAYQESRLNPSATGGKGEIGIMQVMPATGKMLGFSTDDLKDPNKNIQAGLTYLKQGLERHKDPVLAAAAYNAGLDHPYFSNPDKNPLPDSTKSYLKGISEIGGFGGGAAEEAPAEAPPAAEPASEEDFQAQKTRMAIDAGGALAGAALGKGLDIASNVGKTGAAIRELPGLLGQSRAPGDSSGAKWLQNWGNIQKPGFSGGVPEAAAQYQKMQPQGKIVSGLAKRGLMTPQPVTPGVPPTPQLSIKGQMPTPTPPGALSQAGSAMGRAAGAVARSPIVSGALGGLSMAEQGQEFYNRYKAGDIPGMMISGTGAAGGALQVTPSPALRAVGMGMSAASPLAMMLYDKIRSEPSPLPATEAELRQAAQPAFIFPRP